MMVQRTHPLRPRPIRVSEFEQMIAAGLFDADEHPSELLAGELFLMSGPGIRHASCVNRLNRLFTGQYGDRCIVQVQNPIEVDDHTLALPDLALLRPDPGFYDDRRPGPGDTLLIVEVADSTLRKDLEIKVPLYARAAVAEVWVLDVNGRVAHWFRVPGPNGYCDAAILSGQEQLLLPLGRRPVAVEEILGSA